MDRISSRQNPLVRRFRNAAQGEGTDDILLDGEHLIEEALASGVSLGVVAFNERLANGPLARRLAPTGTAMVIATDAVLDAMSPVRSPSGCVAIAQRPRTDLDRVWTATPELVLLLHDVQDPGNVGAVVRAAEGCGATGMVCSEGTADPFGWKALRGAMGSSFRLPLATKQPLPHTLAVARERHVRIFATTARGGTPLPECDLRGPAAILLGGEGAGLPDMLIDSADARVTIPMRPPVQSLNVAIAAALVLYEAARQRHGDRMHVAF
jgi:TrmH family RNA methyltransferase